MDEGGIVPDVSVPEDCVFVSVFGDFGVFGDDVVDVVEVLGLFGDLGVFGSLGLFGVLDVVGLLGLEPSAFGSAKAFSTGKNVTVSIAGTEYTANFSSRRRTKSTFPRCSFFSLPLDRVSIIDLSLLPKTLWTGSYLRPLGLTRVVITTRPRLPESLSGKCTLGRPLVNMTKVPMNCAPCMSMVNSLPSRDLTRRVKRQSRAPKHAGLKRQMYVLGLSNSPDRADNTSARRFRLG